MVQHASADGYTSNIILCSSIKMRQRVGEESREGERKREDIDLRTKTWT